MPRKYKSLDHLLKPDPKYNDKLIGHFINDIMKKGKKTIAQRIFGRGPIVMAGAIVMGGAIAMTGAIVMARTIVPVEPEAMLIIHSSQLLLHLVGRETFQPLAARLRQAGEEFLQFFGAGPVGERPADHRRSHPVVHELSPLVRLLHAL